MNNVKICLIITLFVTIALSCNDEKLDKLKTSEFVFETTRIIEDYEMPNEDIELL